ncbi:hypothetical protein KC19_4G085600 [Ceratodon purpureus]|uniref:MPN domain-containing protein n=1 Tax=Ceratodon purpureus TaxID=3225 RepID=A0A8T0I6W9_CERPU|nr:hypothetical protein KC19_4G085600 [Ceratodon purpureus]
MSATPGDAATTSSSHDAFVAAKARSLDVDQSLPIRLYYRLASNLLKQASIYRDEKNVLDLYINLLRFTSLVTDTIPNHRDYHLYFQLKVEYGKKLNQILNELEELKPEVLKLIGLTTSDRQDAVLPKNSQNAANNSSLARPTYLRNQPNPNINIQKDYGLSSSSGRRDYLNRPSNSESPVFNPTYLDESTSPVSSSSPRAKGETPTRHSIPGYAGQTIRRSPVRPPKVQYPHSVETKPVELPSLQKALQAVKLSAGAPSVDSTLEASSSIWPKSETLFTTDPKIFSLRRQPSPPSVKASVHTLPMVEQSNTQLRPSQVADPRPGPPRGSNFHFPDTKRRKNLHISSRMLEEFLKLASINTQNNLETCGVLTGYLRKGVFNITTLIIPKQKSTPDTCETLNEEELFGIQEQRGLFQLGWIHTHPKQTCFMSSVDLHTHYSYQVCVLFHLQLHNFVWPTW